MEICHNNGIIFIFLIFILMYVSCSRKDINCMLRYVTVPLPILDLLWSLRWEKNLLQLHLDCMIYDRLATLSMKRWVLYNFPLVLIVSLTSCVALMANMTIFRISVLLSFSPNTSKDWSLSSRRVIGGGNPPQFLYSNWVWTECTLWLCQYINKSDIKNIIVIYNICYVQQYPLMPKLVSILTLG